MLKQVDHIGIAVKNLDKSLATYKRLFQVKAKHIEVLENFSIRIAFISPEETNDVLTELVEREKEA